MFGIGGFELFLIALFGFLIFGPDKLPEMAKMLGKAIAKFKSAQTEMNKVIKNEVFDPNSDEPFRNPLDALARVGEIGTEEGKKDGSASGAEETDTFSERKARYEKKRAEKRAAAIRSGSAAGVVAKTASANEEAEPKASASTAKAKPSADELYGTKTGASKATEKASAPTASKATKTPTVKSDAEKAAARSAAAKKAAATRAANKKAAAEKAASENSSTTNEKGE